MHKYFGFIIDENLSWKNHIASVATKISKTIGLISKLRHFLPYRVLINIYQSLINPYLTYGLIAWGNASKTYINKILFLQKRALRLIYFTERNEHTIPLFIDSKTLPLNFLYYESVCRLMYDVNNRTAPENILDLFSRTSDVHSYSTRSTSSQNFYVKESRLNSQKSAFSRIGAHSWYKIPNCLRTLTKKSFKRKLNEILLDLLETENSYINVLAIASKIENYDLNH